MPRKTLQQRRNPTEDNDNRVRGVVDNLIGIEKPDDIMTELISVLSEGGKVPSSGKYYTFFYNAKTPGMQYDQHPLGGFVELIFIGILRIVEGNMITIKSSVDSTKSIQKRCLM